MLMAQRGQVGEKVHDSERDYLEIDIPDLVQQWLKRGQRASAVIIGKSGIQPVLPPYDVGRSLADDGAGSLSVTGRDARQH